jgi:PAS domain S-box-containing protein
MRPHRSIRLRLTLSIIGLTLGALAVGFTLVAVRQVKSFREERLQTMTALADAVGDSTVAELSFGQDSEAAKVLERLQEFEDIVAAALYDVDGALFATYRYEKSTRVIEWPERLAPGADKLQEVRDDVTVVRIPVEYDGELYGTIELVASNADLANETRSFLWTLGGIAAALLILSTGAGWLLQRRITRPIFELASVARRISGGETSLRAATGYGGELGTLADGFNAMLARLEAREREVVASRDLMRAVIDASPVAIIRLDDAGKVTLWSARAAEIFGAAEAEAIGRAIDDVIDDPSLSRIWATAVREPLVQTEVDAVGGKVLGLAGEPLDGGGAVIMVSDVTERRRSAEALAERALHLQRAQKMEVVGRLAGGVAHDFNNLLTVVMASCQMLYLRSGQRPELKAYVDNIQNAAQRGAALSRRLLAFSKQQPLEARPLDVRTVVSDLEKMVRSVVSENITVAVELTEVAAVVLADQGQLEQVLLNMVLNARDAMPRGGVLSLRARAVDVDATEQGPRRSPTGSWIAVSVTDTGIGMSPETVARVFEPFFTTKEHGTGLGLATAIQIAHDVGGEITVTSKVGRGTTFTLWLPRVRDLEAAAIKEASAVQVTGTDTVLLVEDEPALRNLVQIMLAEAGYHVLAAATPKEALALGSAAGVVIDLLLTDVVMPEMSGPQLATELVRRNPDVQVLYMSGYVGDSLSQHGFDEGAAVLIHKPFKPEQLLKVVRDVLDARPMRRARRASELLFGRNPEGGTA